jgi:hypothetical protein
MKEYDEVELTENAPDWHLRAGSRGVVVDAVHGDDFVAVEFYEQDGDIAVHLVPVSMLRVTDPYVAPVAAPSETAHP